ncbi:hypothetical protein FOZ61_010744 [Perkinsus olseni]|uniref:Protein kinase domain-containing protein n=1 Tax=Perkinsus olseni TaxID=32597 RepID=A0A7J6KVB5_PEROL|nr:hypothetical protein FOZ61_010744 [Perkinsus olseni]
MAQVQGVGALCSRSILDFETTAVRLASSWCYFERVERYLSEGISFSAPYDLRVFSVLGSGAYGTVVAAEKVTPESSKSDKKNEEDVSAVVAVKKFSNPLSHVVYAKRTLREIRFLRHLRHENIIELESIYVSGESQKDFGDIYVVTDVMDTDLGYIIRSGQPVTLAHIKFFLYQILRAVKYIHSAGIIHRDIKPKNILVSKTCDLKICDFGLARLAEEGSRALPGTVGAMTEYVCTRWYRAPEVLCCWSKYSYPIDMWSIGCVLAEMFVRKTILKGNSTIDQLEKICTLLGSPDDEEIDKIPNDKAKTYLKMRPHRLPKKSVADTFPEIVQSGGDEAVHMVDSLVQFDPEKRLTVEEAISDPFMDQLHDPTDEPVFEEGPVNPREFAFEKRRLDRSMLRGELFKEVMWYHPHLGEGGVGPLRTACDDTPTSDDFMSREEQEREWEHEETLEQEGQMPSLGTDVTLR